MICALCGETIHKENELVAKLTVYKSRINKGQPVLVKTILEDGTTEKLMHLFCPVSFGAPLSIIGADSRRDV